MPQQKHLEDICEDQVIACDTPSSVANMETIHPELYQLWSGNDKICQILVVLLQSHG